jgi:hypothetical protein
MTSALNFDSSHGESRFVPSSSEQPRNAWIRPELREINFRATAGGKPSDKELDGANNWTS